MPESAKAFTLPWRTQSNSVRTFTLRYWAASVAVSQSLAGVDRLLIGFPRLVVALSGGEQDQAKQQDSTDYH